MNKQAVLLVEDELVLAEIVQESLQSRGFEVLHAPTIKEALKLLKTNRPNIMVLDVMLTDGDGFSLARQIRMYDVNLPIIFLTSKSATQDVVTGFESGGNDYLKKPFSIEELIIRIKALLNSNRLAVPPEPLMQPAMIGNYLFDYPSHTLSYFNHKRNLTSRESEILKTLLGSKGLVVDRRALLLQLWGNDDYFSGRSLDVFMAKLRKYLKEDPSVNILNIRGQGYKLIY